MGIDDVIQRTGQRSWRHCMSRDHCLDSL